MKSAVAVAVALALATSSAEARLLARSSPVCPDQSHRALVQTQLTVMGIECENMCKRLGTYPNCQCPGFNGKVASSGDTRKCIDKYCQDPKTPCPTDAFVTCVKETTAVSALQWDALLQGFNSNPSKKTAVTALIAESSAATKNATCAAQDKTHRAFIQTNLAVLGIECENMCKRLGIYPNCQCPGFNGKSASSGDTRKCIDKYCQDPKTPCPTDAFVTCVKETTAVSALQWDALLQGFSGFKQA